MPRFFNSRKGKTEDSQFWEDIIVREEGRNRSSNSKKGIKVVIDAKEGVAAVADKNDNCWKVRVPFKGMTIRGTEEKMFNKKMDKLLKQDILEQYVRSHKYVTEYHKSRILKKINKNVDLKVYKALRDYDIANYNNTNKSEEYVDALIRSISVQNKKTDNSRRRAKNEMIARRKQLKKSGITVSYDLRNLVFNKNNPIDNIKVLANALKYRKFAEVKLPRFTINPTKRKIRKVRKVSKKKVIKVKKKEKQIVPLKLNKSQKQKNYKSKESLINKFKNKVNETNWTKVVKRGLAVAGIIGLAGLAGYMSGYKKVDDANKNANKGQEITIENKDISNFDINKPILETKDFKIVELGDLENKKDSQEINSQFNIQHVLEGNTEKESNEIENQEDKNNIEVNNEESTPIIENEKETLETNVKAEDNNNEVQNEEKVILKDALIQALGLGFDTEFSMGNGRYYEAPEKTGRSGGYSNISNKIKINYIDAIEDGEYYKYSIKDGKSIADIKKEHPNAKLSYHVVTSSGMVLGWNDSTENNIEINMIKGALMEMKSYIASETMEYLCANDLNGKVSSSEFSEYIQELQEAQAQAKESKNLGKSVKER